MASPAPVARGGRTGLLLASMALPAPSFPKHPTHRKVGHKVLVLNASFEPLSVISASRALSLLWGNKAMTIVPHEKRWTSCSGEIVDLPSVVCLRRYIKTHQKYPVVNRRTVLMRDRGLCQYCGRLAENVDHVTPRSRGGGNNWENVVASCAPCNNRKADKLLKETDMVLKKQPTVPSKESWVHAAVYKVDPRWFPYVGDSSWASIEAMWKGTKLEKRLKVAKERRNPTAKKTKGDKKKEKRARLAKASAARKDAVENAVSMYSPTSGEQAPESSGEE